MYVLLLKFTFLDKPVPDHIENWKKDRPKCEIYMHILIFYTFESASRKEIMCITLKDFAIWWRNWHAIDFSFTSRTGHISLWLQFL